MESPKPRPLGQSALPEPGREYSVVIPTTRRRGSQSTYDPAYCDLMLDYFESAPLEIERVTRTDSLDLRGPSKKEIYVTSPAKIPSFEAFAEKIHCTTRTLELWCKEYKDFAEAHARCKQIQKNWIVSNATANLINPQWAVFLATNLTDMVQKTETTVKAEPPAALRDLSADELVQMRQHLDAAKAIAMGKIIETTTESQEKPR